MSSMSSLLPLLLLCLTMHSCRARNLNVINKKPGEKIQISVKEVEKERSVKTSIGSEVMTSKLDELQTGQPRVANGESFIIERRGGASTQRPKHSGFRRRRMKKKKKIGKVTAVSSVQSLVSVSWHVSHNKQKGHPGFNLDYAPPKIHPPSHN